MDLPKEAASSPKHIVLLPKAKQARLDHIRKFTREYCCKQSATTISPKQNENDNVVNIEPSNTPLSASTTPRKHPARRTSKDFSVRVDFPTGNRKKHSNPVSQYNVVAADGSGDQNLRYACREKFLASQKLVADLKWNADTAGNDKSVGNPESSSSRDKVKEVVELYRQTYAKLIRENKTSSVGMIKVDVKAAMILKANGQWLNASKHLGNIPGIEIGDKFQNWAELNVVGLHRSFYCGIDCVKKDGITVASSIVASWRYNNYMESSDTLIYSGHGGNPLVRHNRLPEDQKLYRGNLALENSMKEKSPVRVVRLEGFKSSKASSSSVVRPQSASLVYDGLYLVEKYWQERGPCGKLIFKFSLKRIQGKPKLISKRSFCKDLLINDVSQGKERMPIHLVNKFDDEKPPLFTYVPNLTFLRRYNQRRSSGCDCTDGCSDSEDCSCKIKNGGEIPYDYSEHLVKKMPFIYECGPSCKCFASCINRVSQRGIQFQLEVFRTASRGWGVRSRSNIPSGRFICEYVGDILQGKEAKERVDNGKYLFDMGCNCDNHNFGYKCIPISSSHHSSSQGGNERFIIDASQRGNVGRFIRHSSSPNLYAQKVLYDHRLPRIMFFAIRDIPPLQELTCNYNLSSL